MSKESDWTIKDQQQETAMYHQLSLNGYTAKCRSIRNQYTLTKVLLNKKTSVVDMHVAYHRLLALVGINLGLGTLSNNVTVRSLAEFEPLNLRGRDVTDVLPSRGIEATKRKISNVHQTVDWLKTDTTPRNPEIDKTIQWLKKGG